MKKIVIIAIALFSLNAIAQPHDSHRKRDQQRNQEKPEMNLSPEEMATLKAKKMTLHLDLTSKQQSQVKELLLKQAFERQQRLDSKPKNEDGTFKKPSKDDIISMRNQKLDDQIEMKQNLKSILSKEQYEKFNKDLGQREGKHKKKPHGNRDQRRN